MIYCLVLGFFVVGVCSFFGGVKNKFVFLFVLFLQLCVCVCVCVCFLVWVFFFVSCCFMFVLKNVWVFLVCFLIIVFWFCFVVFLWVFWGVYYSFMLCYFALLRR